MISNPRQDIIQKLLADLSRIFAELMGFDTHDALEQIQQYYQEWLGLKKEELLSHDPDELLPFLLKEKQFTTDQLELLAQLFGKEGEILLQNKQILAAKGQIRKALVIFGYVEEKSLMYSLERRQIIEKLKVFYSNN